LNDEKAGLSDDDEHHEMGSHNYIASGGVVPRGEQPGIGSYRRLCLGRPAGQASNPCRKVFLAVVFVAIAALFNPIVPIARSGSNVLWLNVLGLATFLTAALALRSGRRLTVLSITSRLPRRESL